MHHYPHHIGDFNNATRHLTRLERGIYRDLMELYYDTESPLPKDINSICRKILARDQQEVTAVEQVLNEFFYLTDEGHVNDRCQDVIEAYQNSIHNKRAAGKKSAKARKLLKQNNKSGSTGVDLVLEQSGNRTATGVHNQEPRTNNHKPIDKTLDQSEIDLDLLFDKFWLSGIRKVNKKKARPLFLKILAKEDDKVFFASSLCNDVHLRLMANQLGFAEMHPTTYLNGERWNDEIKPPQLGVQNENNQGFNTSGRPSLVERVAENGRQFLRDKGIIEEPGEYLGGETLDQVNGDVRT